MPLPGRVVSVCFLCALLLVPLPVQAQPDHHDPWTPLLIVTSTALAGADLAQTMHCRGAGGCREVNPLLRPLQDRPGWYGAAKAGLSVGLILAIQHHTKPRSMERYSAYVVVVALQAAVVAVNARQLQRRP